MADQWPPGILLFACLALGWQGHDATAETSTLPTNRLSAPWFLYYAIFTLLLNMFFRIDTVSLNKDSGKCHRAFPKESRQVQGLPELEDFSIWGVAVGFCVCVNVLALSVLYP